MTEQIRAQSGENHVQIYPSCSQAGRARGRASPFPLSGHGAAPGCLATEFRVKFELHQKKQVLSLSQLTGPVQVNVELGTINPN